MTVPAGYYEQSYPPSVLTPGPVPLQVQPTSGWLPGGDAQVGTSVTIEIWDEEQAVLAPTQVDWGDGSRNTALTHIYVVAAAGPLHIVVTANSKVGSSAGFAVLDPGAQLEQQREVVDLAPEVEQPAAEVAPAAPSSKARK